MFNLPINPFLNKKDTMGTYIPFLKKHKNLIESVYFTCRIPPFMNDSMGVIIDDDEAVKTVKQGLFIQNETGILATAVFNAPNISPCMDNLKIFIKNFAPLYEAGIKSMTLIQAHWAGFVKKEFPKIKIRSSVVRPIKNAQNFIELGLTGYDVIQIDRNLMRNQDELQEIAKARIYLQKNHNLKVDICLLANEHCRGLCPFQEEHYLYNSYRKNAAPYLFSDLSEISCGKWRTDPAFRLKICDMPPYKKEWDKILQYVQSFKMHGREDIASLNSSMRIIKNFALNKEIIDEEKHKFIKTYNLDENQINIWLEKIKTCKSQCFKCGLCDRLAKGNI
jgi:hypothetical protein